MNPVWIKPELEEIEVNGECTAYAGARSLRPSPAVPASARVDAAAAVPERERNDRTARPSTASG